MKKPKNINRFYRLILLSLVETNGIVIRRVNECFEKGRQRKRDREKVKMKGKKDDVAMNEKNWCQATNRKNGSSAYMCNAIQTMYLSFGHWQF